MQILSISGTRPLPGGAANGAAKHALVARSRSMSQESRDEGIRVSLAHPGSIEANERPGAPAEEGWARSWQRSWRPRQGPRSLKSR